MIPLEGDRQECQEPLGCRGHLWGPGVQVGLEDQRRRSLLHLGVLVQKVLVAQVVQVGLGGLVDQDPGQRGPRRWSCCCSGTIHQQVLARLVGLAVLGDQLGQRDLGHLEVLGVPWLQEALGALGQ